MGHQNRIMAVGCSSDASGTVQELYIGLYTFLWDVLRSRVAAQLVLSRGLWRRDKCCLLCSNFTFGERQDSGIVLKIGGVVCLRDVQVPTSTGVVNRSAVCQIVWCLRIIVTSDY